MKSFIVATLLVATLGFAAPPDEPSTKATEGSSNPDYASLANKLPDESVEALKRGVKFVLFSLEPSISERELKKLMPEQKYLRFEILGSTELANAETKKSAITTITDAVKNSDGMVAMCFSPRHSLRAITSNGTIYDFVICFECNRIRIYSGGKRIGEAGIKGTPKPLDEILTAAKIPLAKPPEAE